MTTPETCRDCTHPATTHAYAGRWKPLGDHWLDITPLPLCDYHADEDARARAEARAS